MRCRPGARRIMGLPAPDLSPSLAVSGELLDGLANDGVMAAAHTTASNRRYTGADINAQQFLMPASAQAGDVDRLGTGATMGNSRNALNRRRGA